MVVILTLTLSPTCTKSIGFFTKVSAISEICTSPSFLSHTSTNAQKATTFLTTPSRISPSFRVFILTAFFAFVLVEVVLFSFPISE